MSDNYTCDVMDVILCGFLNRSLQLEPIDYTILNRWDASIRRRLALKGVEDYLNHQIPVGRHPPPIDKWAEQVCQVNLMLLDSLCELQSESNGSFFIPDAEFMDGNYAQKTYENIKDILREYFQRFA